MRTNMEGDVWTLMPAGLRLDGGSAKQNGLAIAAVSIIVRLPLDTHLFYLRRESLVLLRQLQDEGVLFLLGLPHGGLSVAQPPLQFPDVRLQLDQPGLPLGLGGSELPSQKVSVLLDHLKTIDGIRFSEMDSRPPCSFIARLRPRSSLQASARRPIVPQDGCCQTGDCRWLVSLTGRRADSYLTMMAYADASNCFPYMRSKVGSPEVFTFQADVQEARNNNKFLDHDEPAPFLDAVPFKRDKEIRKEDREEEEAQKVEQTE
ncbi:unnamed protein product [Nezara viridula]|uniref:Uncharacterized protein n=1 Tax=Nezara viridula TaxID=85310 RepID=A0A9P0E322_NEZVI|nr:unnamed protein product [Nezara viridula]